MCISSTFDLMYVWIILYLILSSNFKTVYNQNFIERAFEKRGKKRAIILRNSDKTRHANKEANQKLTNNIIVNNQ